MDISKLVLALSAVVLSGWSLCEAGRSAQALQRPEIHHRSVADELRRMQAGPEEALVLWVPGELESTIDAPPPAELVAISKARRHRGGASNGVQEDAATIASKN